MNDFIELRHIVATIFRRWWLLAAALLLSASATYIISQKQTRIYRAKTSVLVGSSIQSTVLNNRDIETSELLAITYSDIARRQLVLQAVVDELELNKNWQELKSAVSAGIVSGTQVIEITAEAESPEEARRIADEVANQLISLSPTALQNRENGESRENVRQQVNDFRQRIEDGTQQLNDLQEQMLTSTITAEEFNTLQGRADRLQRLITDWESNYTQLLVLIESLHSANYLTIIEPAQASKTPVRPRTTLNTALVGILGMLITATCILLYESLDDSIRTSEAIRQSLGLPLLGEVGYSRHNGLKWHVVSLRDTFGPLVEAFRVIGSQIHFSHLDEPLKSILITSPAEGDGKSTIVANLAIILAQGGVSTLIVDANLRNPVQHEIFKIPNISGWTQLVRMPETDARELIVETEVDHLSILPCGILVNPSELLNSKSIRKAVGQLLELAEVVIFDGSAVLNAAETLILSSQVDGVGLVVESSKASRAEIENSVFALQNAKANLLGVVLNQSTSRFGILETLNGLVPKIHLRPSTQPPRPSIAVRSTSDQ